MYRFVALFLLLLLTASQAGAQVKKKIRKSRRTKSESQFALAKNDFVAEWEIGHEVLNPQLSTTVYPNVVVHYGLSDRTEINTEINLVTAKDKSVSPSKIETGIEPVAFGVNYLLLRDTEKKPSVMLSAQLGIPFLVTKNYSADHLAPTLQINVQQPVRRKTVIGLSAGLFWDGFSAQPSFTYNAEASYTLIKKWVVTGECFGFVNHEPPQNNLDASLTYAMKDFVEFGFTAGMGISAAAHKNYFAINGTWGLNTAKKKSKTSG